MTSTLRPTTNKYHTYLPKCLNCKETGHTLSNCDDSSIRILNTACKNNAILFSESHFIEWLTINYKVPLLKALCRKIKLVVFTKKEKIIKSLLDYYYFQRHFDELISLLEAIQQEPEPEPEQKRQNIHLTVKNKEEEEDKEKEKAYCPICYEPSEATYNCYHSICAKCLSRTLKTNNNILRCSLCRTQVTHICSNTHEIYINVTKIIL